MTFDLYIHLLELGMVLAIAFTIFILKQREKKRRADN